MHPGGGIGSRYRGGRLCGGVVKGLKLTRNRSLDSGAQAGSLTGADAQNIGSCLVRAHPRWSLRKSSRKGRSYTTVHYTTTTSPSCSCTKSSRLYTPCLVCRRSRTECRSSCAVKNPWICTWGLVSSYTPGQLGLYSQRLSEFQPGIRRSSCQVDNDR
jgi:hypothetical protein